MVSLKSEERAMVVISYRIIREFSEKYPEAKDQSNTWYRIMLQADFANFHEIKTVFNSADPVGNDRYVFDIKGNKYRLITMIHFNIRTVYILFAGSHKAYDKIDASTIKLKK